MKCPKCGYLGFETTDRCRNCGYDFSLAPFASEPELPLRTNEPIGPASDFELSGITRPSDNPNSGSLDLDRLFGAEPVAKPAFTPSSLTLTSALGSPTAAPGESAPLVPAKVVLPHTQVVDLPEANLEKVAATTEGESGPSALPFEEAPIAPPPARAPLGVRRATPEVPRGRSRTTRPARVESPLSLELDSPSAVDAGRAGDEAALPVGPPSLAARLGADAIDFALLALICAAVLALTLRIAGLSMTWEDVRILPVIPFVGFLVLLAFGYVAAFTVAGGQTIGKMLTGIKVIGDDGRAVDTAGGVLRALGCALVPLTIGLSYVPVFITSDRRALHDRLAGTRVVSQ